MSEQKTKDDGYVSIATKVPTHVAELLSLLAKMRDMEVYELLQLLVNGFISYAKSETDVPDEFRHLYESLKFDVAWNQAYNFASPTAQQDIAQMVLVLQQPGRTGFGMVMIDKPFMDEARMTTAAPDIVARVLELALGFHDFVRLRQARAYHQCTDLIDLVKLMLDAQTIIDITESDRAELPGYDNHHDYGKIIEYGQKTKRKKHVDPDSLARQQRIRFDEDDATTTDTPDLKPYGEKADAYFRDLEERAKEEELGFRPFDQEY